MNQRNTVLTVLAARVLSVSRPHPVRVAIDGCSTAGKTTLAGELADALRRRTSRVVLQIGIDHFMRAVELRTAYPLDTPESYYLDSWDLTAICEQVLLPLGPGGSRRYLDEVHPQQRADLVIDNCDPAAPLLTFEKFTP